MMKIDVSRVASTRWLSLSGSMLIAAKLQAEWRHHWRLLETTRDTNEVQIVRDGHLVEYCHGGRKIFILDEGRGSGSG